MKLLKSIYSQESWPQCKLGRSCERNQKAEVAVVTVFFIFSVILAVSAKHFIPVMQNELWWLIRDVNKEGEFYK